MTIEFNLSNIIIVFIASISGLWALMKIIGMQFKREINRDLQEHFKLQDVSSSARNSQINTRLDGLDSAVKVDAGQWQRVERELLHLKAELPIHYVRREDYIRGQSVLEAKLDGLALKLDIAQLRSVQSGKSHP